MTALDHFSAPTRAWFEASFASPTPAQEGAWDAIAHGRNALVVAPTGSGKTLSAFLNAIDTLLTSEPPTEKLRRTRVLYISPLKALAVDVERNLRAPLTGIRHTAERLEVTVPEVTVGLRSGDTSPADRRKLATTPPDILITTPESLFLMLTSQARETLRGIESIIIDEVHAVAGTKRGAHLALSLERLDALLDKPAQRIGLSATVRPLEEVARFLGGAQPVEIVSPPSSKEWDLRVVVPVEDMTMPEEYDEESGDPRRSTSIWPHVEEHVVDLIEQHRSTIVFANSRRLAERLTARLNEIATERAELGAEGAEARSTATATGEAAGADHGAVRRQQRRRGGHRQGPPRLGVQGAAGDHRGRPQARSTPLRRGDQQPRARHRHGRGRPGHPDRVAAQRRERPPAGRPRRPPGGRGQPGRALPQAPRRPGPDRRRGGADAQRGDREAVGPGQPARRTRPAARGVAGDGRLGCRRVLRARRARGVVRPAPPRRL